MPSQGKKSHLPARASTTAPPVKPIPKEHMYHAETPAGTCQAGRPSVTAGPDKADEGRMTPSPEAARTPAPGSGMRRSRPRPRVIRRPV